MKNKKIFALILCAFAAAINIVLGTLVGQLKVPLIFLDTMGTIFAAMYFGPWYGAAVGADIFTSAFIPRITGNIIDKVISSVLVWDLIKKLPAEYRPRIDNNLPA